MGLLPTEKVPPLTLLRNPAIDRHRINREGEVVTATGTSEILVEQIVDAMGARRPDYLHSQKEFRLGFVFLTTAGHRALAGGPRGGRAGPARVRRALLRPHERRRLGGHEPRLDAPGASRREPDLARALAWLAAQQGLDGSWSDSPETRVRDTATAVLALLRAGAAGARRAARASRGCRPPAGEPGLPGTGRHARSSPRP